MQRDARFVSDSWAILIVTYIGLHTCRWPSKSNDGWIASTLQGRWTDMRLWYEGWVGCCVFLFEKDETKNNDCVNSFSLLPVMQRVSTCMWSVESIGLVRGEGEFMFLVIFVGLKLLFDRWNKSKQRPKCIRFTQNKQVIGRLNGSTVLYYSSSWGIIIILFLYTYYTVPLPVLSLPVFRRELKTVLFRSSFPDATWQSTVLYLLVRRSVLICHYVPAATNCFLLFLLTL